MRSAGEVRGSSATSAFFYSLSTDFLFPCLPGGTALAGSGKCVALPRRTCWSMVNVSWTTTEHGGQSTKVFQFLKKLLATPVGGNAVTT